MLVYQTIGSSCREREIEREREIKNSTEIRNSNEIDSFLSGKRAKIG